MNELKIEFIISKELKVNTVFLKLEAKKVLFKPNFDLYHKNVFISIIAFYSKNAIISYYVGWKKEKKKIKE